MLQPGDDIGRYRVVSTIGKGGMAMVYQVVDQSDGSPWALKVLTLEEPGLAERFISEAEMQAVIDHPHVVRARELVRVGPRLGIVMEYVEGPSLDRWLYDNPEATPQERLGIALQLLEGVGAAHRAGMVHRDLKPGNVLIAREDDGWVAKVTDFGLAKLRGSQPLTLTGVAMGTPRYMAPEQLVDAKHVDARADVYALGAVLFELYTGQPAFRHATFAEAFQAVEEGSYTDPASLGVSRRVSRAIRAALEPNRDLRVRSCADLADLLKGRTPRSVRRTRRRVFLVSLVAAGAAFAAAWWWAPDRMTTLSHDALTLWHEVRARL